MIRSIAFVFCIALLAGPILSPGNARAAPAARAGFTLEQVLFYPFPQDLTAARSGRRIAWVIDQNGVRNVRVANAPRIEPREVTRFTADDGQDITRLTISPDGDELVFVRGRDHDANWPVKVAADPDDQSAGLRRLSARSTCLPQAIT
ncbi:MAG: hypothetical protein ACREPL_10800 [Rhodanobacteraceae bacterium]